MPGRCKRNVRAKKRAVSDINRRVVHKRKTEVCIYVSSEMNEHSAKIRRERRLDMTPLAQRSEPLHQQRKAFFLPPAGARG